MPKHLADYLAAGRHVPCIFTINLSVQMRLISVQMRLIIEQLILIAGASHEDEYIDQIVFIPL